MKIILLATLLQTPAPTAAQAKSVWAVDWGDARCTLERRNAAGVPSFALWKTPGTYYASLIVPGDAGLPAAGDTPASIAMDGVAQLTAAKARPVFLSPGARRAAAVGPLAEDFVAAFGRASSIRVAGGGRPILDVALAGTAKAVAALKACEDDALKRWGIDPAARAALRSRPEPTGEGTYWISYMDYPEAAIRAGAGGSVTVKLTVGRDGRVGGCAVLVGSGRSDLDAQTCRSARMRARFRPAADASGAAVEADVVHQVRWMIGR